MEVVNVDGGTPLHAALINNENDCIDVLLEAGAEVNAKMEIGGNEVETRASMLQQVKVYSNVLINY